MRNTNIIRLGNRPKKKLKTEPMICPACKTPYWRTKRKNKKNKEVKK